MTQKRVILRAELAPQAKTGLEKICEARGMTQLSVMSRLIMWFSTQDGRLQHAVLGNTDDDASKMVLEDLVRRNRPGGEKVTEKIDGDGMTGKESLGLLLDRTSIRKKVWCA